VARDEVGNQCGDMQRSDEGNTQLDGYFVCYFFRISYPGAAINASNGEENAVSEALF